MTPLAPIRFAEPDPAALGAFAGRIAVLVASDGRLDQSARKVDRLMRGALLRAAGSQAFARLAQGEALELAFPSGMACEAVQLVKLDRRADATTVRKGGAAIGAQLGHGGAVVLAGSLQRAAELSFGLALRAYAFADHKSDPPKPLGPVTLMVARPETVAAAAGPLAALAEGVFFARDLVSEPANVLTTDDFAARLAAMQELGLEVEILEEPELAALGMRTLLAVGQGSDSPSKVVVMQWKGGGAEPPLALVGKGVVFDSGGISIKPSAGMEEMTMDMGGAATVAGVMRTLALRKARANVVGLVGLVENMPSGSAQRPGDVVKSMKGDTVEVINTDAEGRLVLADVLWYAQERFNPSGVIDLATLTGAVIVALGRDHAGVFSNDDAFCETFLRAARAEGEGAWRLPMGDAYDRRLKSNIADMKNVGGREGGAIVAAQFLRRFIRPGMPWIHLDIAGAALVQEAKTLAPKGATGWGVCALDRMLRDSYEQD